GAPASEPRFPLPRSRSAGPEAPAGGGEPESAEAPAPADEAELGDLGRLAELARSALEEGEGALRAADLRADRPAPIVRPARAAESGADDDPPRVADGDPRTHLAARATQFTDEGRPFAVLLV